MSVDLKLPFGRFLRLSMNEYRQAMGGEVRAEAWEGEIERAHDAWHAFRKARKAAFTPPTPAEVEEYSRSIGWPLDGEAFCLHYEKKDWCVSGRTKMRNWKAGVRYWKREQVRTKVTPAAPAIAPPAEPHGWQAFIDTQLVEHCRYRTGNSPGAVAWERVDPTFKRLLLDEMAKKVPV